MRLIERMDEYEHAQILQELRKQRWNMNATARALGISRTALYKKRRKYGIGEGIKAAPIAYR